MTMRNYKEQKPRTVKWKKNVMKPTEKKITIVCFLSIMLYTHSDVIYFHSIVVDIFTKTLYFTEFRFFEMFNCFGFMTFWQVPTHHPYINICDICNV